MFRHTLNLKAATKSTQTLNKDHDMEKDSVFPEIAPWTEPVNGQDLVAEIENLFKTYLFLPNGAATVLSYWVMHTYNITLFDYTPRLCITSPEKRCGKTILLSLLNTLSCKPMLAANITPSPMFRLIHLLKPTILIDEADTFLKDNEELRGVINAGYASNGAIVRNELVKKVYIPTKFNCFSPCAIAAIRDIPETIKDRGIIITMCRKTKDEHVQKFRNKYIKQTAQIIQQKCLRFMQDNANQITESTPELPDSFNDRSADIWEPLFQIASVISEENFQNLTKAALALTQSYMDTEPDSQTELLLSDIRHIFGNSIYKESLTLVEALNNIETSPWKTLRHGNGITVNTLAYFLRPFNIKPRQDWTGGHTRKYYKSDFEDAFARYLPTRSDCASVQKNNPENTDLHDCTIDALDIPE